MSFRQVNEQGGNFFKWRQILHLGEHLMRLGQQACADTHQLDQIIRAQCNLIVETAMRLFDADALLWMPATRWKQVSRHQQEEREGMELGEDLSIPTVEPPDDLVQRSWESHKAFARGKGVDIFPLALASQVPSQGCTQVALPVLLPDRAGQEEVLGVLRVARKYQSASFDLEEIELLEGLTTQAGIALQASWQLQSESWRLEQLALVRQVSNQIADLRDLDELARQVTRLILETFDYYYVAIFTVEIGWETLHFRASARSSTTDHPVWKDLSPALLVRRGEGIIGSVAQSGEEILATDVRQEARYLHQDTLPETRSEVALPLKIEDQVLGVLDVQSNQLNDFDETDMLVLRALADSVAYAIEGARLYSALHSRATQLATIQEVSQAITSILDQGELLEQVVELIQRRFGYPYVHLFSVHPGRGKVFYEAGSGARSQALRESRFAFDLDDPEGMIPWVARHGETILSNDVSQESRYRPSTLPPDTTHAELTVPLTFGKDVLGVLDIQSDQIGAFSQEDRFLMETLGDTIAVALRNASLYRSEVWRRQVADSLREVAGLLSAEKDLEYVLNAILLELEHTLPLDVAAIWLLDEEALRNGSSQDSTLYLAAVRGQEVANLDIELGLRPEDILAFNPPPGEILSAETASTWLMEALMGSQPVVRSSQSLFEPLGASLDYAGNYSAIGAPLRTGAHPLGVLVLAHRSAGRYGSEARAMTEAFASYAAVAIENTRLYEAAHEQAWVSTVLLQVAEATQAQSNLEELLDTVVRITPTLSGVKACLLYLLDEAGVFVPAAATGLEDSQQATFASQYFMSSDLPVLERLLNRGTPQILYDNPDDRPLIDTLYADRDTNGNPLLVLVPLIAQGEVLGAFLVDYSSGGASGGALNLYVDERLAIIQGIAQQTAMAVKNVQLIKAQKEEAYVSVALLQVAQAVVSAGDLDEIMGSIVRITPILVGIERSAIYLWDEGQEIFRLAQAYGIPTYQQPPTVTAEEFPFMHAVIQRNQLVATPMAATETVTNDQALNWASASVLDSDEVEIYLDMETRLLLGFPLSVKGQVLGVLLVEEPELADHRTAANTYLRLRKKRLEIITGISQQAALAIQNDLLQRETFERERLAREMQLAREIQQAFLPDELPDAPGWDLQVYWRTAREVGGDFYDIFLLPDGRLGLVIADVADKGMPAALFMTLVRTLVRATVQSLETPDQVLRRVNEIIEPDAPQGMYVTLVYAVIDLQTGRMDYANAGHNPPLVQRSGERRLDNLIRTGMALGVVSDNPIEGKQITLEPGDYLVLYTDGITEAFSPQGELYGNQRLQETIRAFDEGALTDAQPHPATARALLNAIDGAVSKFVEDAPLSDDLTLVVVKRLAAEESTATG